MQTGRRWVVVMAIACAGCGGGTDTVKDTTAQVAELTAKANAAEQLARSLAQDTPCASNGQCAALTFASPVRGACPSPSLFAFYSTVSTTAAAAEAATKEQNARAAESVALQPDPRSFCPAIAFVVAPTCVAGRCMNAVLP